jgi:hypothetical protein
MKDYNAAIDYYRQLMDSNYSSEVILERLLRAQNKVRKNKIQNIFNKKEVANSNSYLFLFSNKASLFSHSISSRFFIIEVKLFHF